MYLSFKKTNLHKSFLRRIPTNFDLKNELKLLWKQNEEFVNKMYTIR